MRVKAYRSPDKRVRTENFASKEGTVFCVAEPTVWGSVVSKFKKSGEIVDRYENERTRDAGKALDMYLTGTAMIEVLSTPTYEHVKAEAVCRSCGKSEIERELDQQKTEEMAEVPVVPIFVCRSCGSKFCSVGEEYIKNLVSKYGRYIAMGKEEKVEDAMFVRKVQDNIIRSFASKNISRLEIKG